MALVVSRSIIRISPSDVVLIDVSFFINLPCDTLAATSIIFLFKLTDAVKPVEATLKEKLLQMDILRFLFITASIV